MLETPEISSDPPSDSGLNDIAAILAEQIAASHSAAARCFSVAADEEDFQPHQREDALRVASRLMHACAAAASAIKRIKGGAFNYHITVERVDVAAEKAARKARIEKAKNRDKDRRAEIMRRIDRIVEAERERLEAEKTQGEIPQVP
mgnify:CR=1 FL=1|jgi:hypothetical protein